MRKLCTDCGKDKAISHFGKDKQKKDGLRQYCKECVKLGNKHGKPTKSKLESVMKSNAKVRSAKDDLPFDLELEDIEIPTHCPVFPEIKLKSNTGGPISLSSPTLDKVVPSKGYVKGNINVISNLANFIKGAASLEQLKAVVAYIEKHNEDIPSPVLEVKLMEKPFSTNKMWYANKKRDTVEYKRFKLRIFNAMKEHRFPVNKDDKYKLSLVTGFSSKLSDLDNAFKPLLDSLQLALGFDDRQVFEIEALKDHTKKGEEYLMIRLETITDSYWKRRIKKLFKIFTGEN